MELRRLSDENLHLKLKSLVASEREVLVQILNHLKEVDRRKLFLEMSHSSLWAYVTQELGYTEAAAQRRIEAMRALREMPSLEEKLEEGSLSLSNIAKAQSLLRKADDGAIKIKAEDKLLIFKELENKSQRQAEVILASHFPEAARIAEKVRPLNSEVSEIRLTAKRELLEKLDRVKSLVSHKNPNASLAELIEIMADFLISKKDPLKAGAIKSKTLTTSKPKDPSQQLQSAAVCSKDTPPPQRRFANSRYVPSVLRHEVWRAAQGCCQFVNPRTNKRCGSRHQLEVEHAMPIALGGASVRENLRLYCRAHNVHVARDANLM